MPDYQFNPNASFVRPQDAMGLIGAALPQGMRSGMMNMAGNAMDGWKNLGMNTEAMQGAQMMPNQMTAPQQGMNPQDKVAAYRMMAGAMQGMAPRQQMPSGNTAQIIRDNNQFRFAGTPQQQMANALRRR